MQSTMLPLQKAYHHFIRLVIGARMSTPIGVIHAGAQFPPLQDKILTDASRTVITSLRANGLLGDDYIQWDQGADEWSPFGPIKRTIEQACSELTPHGIQNTSHLTIHQLNLLYKIKFQISLSHEEAAQKYQQNQLIPRVHTQLWTDGSYRHCRNEGGLGFHWETQSTDIIHEAAFYVPLVTSSYEVECRALDEGLQDLVEKRAPGSSLAVLTDSLSLLMHLNSFILRPRACEDVIYRIFTSLLTLLETYITIHMIFVPGHEEIPGNEKADDLAKEGLDSGQELEPEITFASYKQFLKKHLTKQSRRWLRTHVKPSGDALNPNRQLFIGIERTLQNGKTIRIAPYEGAHNRKQFHDGLFRLRAGHTYAPSSTRRFAPEPDLSCRNCDEPIGSPHHILLECPFQEDKLRKARETFTRKAPHTNNILELAWTHQKPLIALLDSAKAHSILL